MARYRRTDLYGEPGPLPYKPNAAATAIGGIGSILGALAQAKEAKEEKRRLAEDRALKIFAMAQREPWLFGSPMMENAFGAAGMSPPQAETKPMTPEDFIGTIPKGYQGSYQIDPFTGRGTGYKVTARDRMLDAQRRANIERPIPLRTLEGDYLYFPATGQTKSVKDLLEPSEPNVPALPGQTASGSTPAAPNPAQALADQWLAPDTAGAFGPRPSPQGVRAGRLPLPQKDMVSMKKLSAMLPSLPAEYIKKINIALSKGVSPSKILEAEELKGHAK